MTSLSLIAVPVLLDTATDSPQLLRQWSRMYHYGHLIMPSLAAGTLLLHACTALQQNALGKPWGIFACAGGVTIAIAPFTWIVMEGVNGELFGRLEGWAQEGYVIAAKLYHWAAGVQYAIDHPGLFKKSG